MNTFTVKIVTPDGELFAGEAGAITVKCNTGEVQILRGHADYFAPLAIGKAKLTLGDGTEREAACAGGFLSVKGGVATVVATTFEFADSIDLNRAEKAKEEAEERIKTASDDRELRMAKAKLMRALTRIDVADK